MNLSDVKIGDRLVTEKGGVVTVSHTEKTEFGILGTCWWKMDGIPWERGSATERKFGNIIGRESTMNYEKEITDLKARLEKLEPKPEPKLPTEIGSHVRAGDGSREWVLTDTTEPDWTVLGTIMGSHARKSDILDYCRDHGGFQVGRVVWEAE